MTVYLRLLRIGAKNAFRNRRRTLVTVSVIIFAVLAISMLRGMINGINRELAKSVTRMQTGEIQVYRDGYLDNQEISPLNLSIDVDKVDAALENATQVAASAPRVRFGGMLSAGSTTPFMSLAVDPKREIETCTRLEENLVAGRFINPDGRGEIVMTEDLAKSLKLELGDSVVLLSVTRDGAQNTSRVKVVGLLATMMRSARMLTYTHIDDARVLLNLGPTEATELVAIVADGADYRAVRDEVTTLTAGLGVEVHIWEEVAGFFKQAMDMQDGFNVLVSIILFVLAASIIINTVLMSVFERTREIGMMRALGMKARHIRGLFVAEGFYIGVAGGAIGAALSLGLMAAIRMSGGFEYELARDFGSPKPWILYPYVNLAFAVGMLAFGAFCGVIASIYPARRASQLHPREALADV